MICSKTVTAKFPESFISFISIKGGCSKVVPSGNQSMGEVSASTGNFDFHGEVLKANSCV